MKKCLLLVCGVLMALSSTQAEGVQAGDSCARGGGTVVIGNNGTVYCKSNHQMNWWTALDWCQQQGKQLIQYPADCSCVEDGCPPGKCPNLAGIGEYTVWTSTANPQGTASYVDLKSGASINSPRTQSYGPRALCK